MGIDAAPAGSGHSCLQQAIIGAGCKVDLFEHAKGWGGEGGGGHGNHHIAQFDLRAHATGRADTDQSFGIIVFDQLIDVDRQARHAHARSLNGDRVAAPKPREAQHAAHLVDAFRIVQKRLRRPFCAQRIPRQEYSFRNFARLRTNMNGHDITSNI